MRKVEKQLQRMETKFLQWADFCSYSILRMSIGIIYVLFGILKFFPNHSPAEQLAVDTIEILSLGLFSGSPALLSLAVIETGIGLCLLFHYRLRLTIYLAIGHMFGTFLPFFFFPEQTFAESLYSLNLVGQYIIKNLVFVGGLFVLYTKSAKKQGRVIMMPTSKKSEISASAQIDIHDFHQKRQQNK